MIEEIELHREGVRAPGRHLDTRRLDHYGSARRCDFDAERG
jgi:hypothetical protein